MAKKLKSDEVEEGRTSVCGHCMLPIAMVDGEIVHTDSGVLYGFCEASIRDEVRVLPKRRKLI